MRYCFRGFEEDGLQEKGMLLELLAGGEKYRRLCMGPHANALCSDMTIYFERL